MIQYERMKRKAQFKLGSTNLMWSLEVVSCDRDTSVLGPYTLLKLTSAVTWEVVKACGNTRSNIYDPQAQCSQIYRYLSWTDGKMLRCCGREKFSLLKRAFNDCSVWPTEGSDTVNSLQRTENTRSHEPGFNNEGAGESASGWEVCLSQSLTRD